MILTCYSEGMRNMARFLFYSEDIDHVAEAMRCLCVAFVYDGYYFKADSHLQDDITLIEGENSDDVMEKIWALIKSQMS